MPRYLLISALLFFFFIGQHHTVRAQRLSWKNFTVDQGLAGNVVYETLQDSKGYFWFTTDQGICRFNGYDFIQPVDTSSMRGSEAFLPTEDAQGRIWFTRLNSTIWFIENDTVRAWKYNSLIEEVYQKSFRYIEQMVIDEDGAVWLALPDRGFLTVDKNGSHRLFPDLKRLSFLFAETSGNVIYTIFSLSPPPRSTTHSRIRHPIEVLEWENGRTITKGQVTINFNLEFSGRGIWKLQNGDFICSYQGVFCLIRDNRILWRANLGLFAERVRETPTGEILIAAHSGKLHGLFLFASIDHVKKGQYRNLLPDYFVTDVCIDREGGWWASTHHAGIFYCKNPHISIFDDRAGMNSSEVTCLTNDGKTTVFAGLCPANIVALTVHTSVFHNLPPPPVVSREIQAIWFDPFKQRLWCSDWLSFFEKNQWKQATWFDQYSSRIRGVPAKKITPDLSGETIWTSSALGFYGVDLQKGLAKYHTENGTLSPARTFSITPDAQGNIWVTTSKGLRLWRNGQYQLPPFDHPALRFQPHDVLMLPSGGMVIAVKGSGLLFRSANGVFTHLTQEDGLTSDFITKLYQTPEGQVYGCSHIGLNRLTLDAAGAWRIETISAKQGLPSNQVNDVTTLAGEIWVATNKGLARFRNLPLPLPMPAPILEKLTVNNRQAAFIPGLRLTYHENNLSLRFFALHYRSGGNIPYRYRLAEVDSAFTYTNNREINFARLSPGSYTFEVQAQNEAGAWSASTRWNFEIRAAWWQTVWFWGALTALLFSILGLWYRNRLRTAQHEAEIQHKIQDLEAAALRAQMNPHFIFNCLNSIQHFITENDAASATRYLSRFARLVRLALHGSVDGRHSLREEMDMLENYLALEQLRFRGKFSYTIEADPALDADDVFMPPMLVQPFVENALLHGMKNKEAGGQISVLFSIKDNALLVTVTDNGPGDPSGHDHLSKTDHKSIGMTLTHHRLEILAGQEALSRENILGPDGAIQGMRVVLLVPIGA